MGGEARRHFHVQMISERYKRESIARDRMIAHFVKGVFDWCLLNAVTGEVPNGGPGNGQTLHGLVGPEKVNCISRFSYLRFNPLCRSSNATLPFLHASELRTSLPRHLAQPASG